MAIYNTGKYFAPRYFADNYWDTEGEAGGGPSFITASLLGTSAIVGTLSDIQPALGSLSHLRPDEFMWPSPRKRKREIVFAKAAIKAGSTLEAKGNTRYSPVRYDVIEKLIRKYQDEIIEDDEEVLLLMV